MMNEMAKWRVHGEYRGAIDDSYMSPDALLLGAVELWKHLNPIVELEATYDSDF
jgi:hypothetical protein